MFFDEMFEGFCYLWLEDEQDKQLLVCIECKGWYYFSVDGVVGELGYVFMLGYFFKWDYLELIVVGFKDILVSCLLDSVVVGIIGLGCCLWLFQVYGDIVDGLEVVFLFVVLLVYNEYLGYVNWFYVDLFVLYLVL